MRSAIHIIACCVLVSCDDTAGPVACAGPVTVSVGSGARPTISWSPACLLGDVLVDSPAPGGTIYYRATSPQVTNVIGPPVRFGEARPGLFTVPPQADLVTGGFYRVTVSRADSSGHFMTVGILGFVR